MVSAMPWGGALTSYRGVLFGQGKSPPEKAVFAYATVVARGNLGRDVGRAEPAGGLFPA